LPRKDARQFTGGRPVRDSGCPVQALSGTKQPGRRTRLASPRFIADRLR
jgi:hypothetical protein